MFEVDGRQHPVSRMFAFRDIEHFDVVEDVLSSLLACFVGSAADKFPFEQVKEAFSDCVVMAIPAPAQGVLDVVAPQKRRSIPTGILQSLIGVN